MSLREQVVVSITSFINLINFINFRALFPTTPLISKSIVWNNKNIKIDGKTIYYPNYVKAGILFYKHMQLNMNNLESYNCVKRNGLKHTNF